MPERSILRFSRRKAGCFLIQKNPRQIAEGFQTSYPCGVFITSARIFPWNHGVYSANFAPGQNDSVRQFQNAHSCKRKRLWHGTHLLGCYQMQTAQPKCCPLKSKPQDKRFLCFSIALRFRKSKHLTSFFTLCKYFVQNIVESKRILSGAEGIERNFENPLDKSKAGRYNKK